MDWWSALCEKAQREFAANSPYSELVQPHSSTYETQCEYIPLSAGCTYGRLPHDNSSDFHDSFRNVDPIDFIMYSGKGSLLPHKSKLSPPYLTLIVGEYGLGKTELICQLVNSSLNKSDEPTAPIALPIALSRCRKYDQYAKMLTNGQSIGAQDMCRLLFHHLVSEPYRNSPEIYSDITERMVRGDIILLLDGLDELVSDGPMHRQFFRGLSKLLDTGPDTIPRYRVVVTCRLEYLDANDNLDGEELNCIRWFRQDLAHIPVFPVIKLRPFDYEYSYLPFTGAAHT